MNPSRFLSYLNPASVLAIALGAIVSTPLQASAQENPVIGALRISSIEELRTAIAGFAEVVQPGSGAAAEMVPQMAAAFGLDTTREVSAVLLSPGVSSAPFALILPVVDAASVIQNPQLGFEEIAQEAGTYSFQFPGMSETMYGAFEGATLVAAPLVENLALVKPLVAGGAITSALKEGGGQVALGLSIGKLWLAYKPMVNMLLGGMGGPADPAVQMMQGQIKNLVATVDQLDGLALRLTIEPAFANLSLRLTAMEGTDLAQLFASEPANAPALVGLAQENAGMIGQFSIRPTPESIKSWSEWMGGYLNMMAQLIPAAASADPSAAGAEPDPAIAEAVARSQEYISEWFGLWDGTGTFGAFPSGGTAFMRGTYGITDSAKTIDLMRRTPEFMDSYAKIFAATGLEMSARIEAEFEHNGATVFDLRVTQKGLDTDSDAGDAAVNRKMEEALGFSPNNMATVYAVKDNVLFYTGGDGAVEEVKSMIDRAGSAPVAPVSPDSFGFGENPAAFFAASATSIIKRLGEAGVMPVDLSAAPAAPDYGIGAGLMLNGSAEIQISVRSAHVHSAMQMAAPAAEAARAPAMSQEPADDEMDDTPVEPPFAVEPEPAAAEPAGVPE